MGGTRTRSLPAFISLFFQESPVSGRKADVIKAAHLCAEAALRLVKPGNQVRGGVSE